MLRSEISRIKLKGTRLYMRLLLRVLRLLFRIFPWSRRRISIGYLTQNPKHMDGLGAQLQRVIAVRGLAVYWGLLSWQPNIPKIAVHPLDGFETEEAISEYVEKVNNLIDGKIMSPDQRVVYVEEIGFFPILLTLLRANIRDSHVFLMVSLPFRFVDSLPNIYSLGAYNYRERLKQHVTLKQAPKIAIHHRWTTGYGVVQPGQRVSRSVSINRFREILDEFETLTLNELYIFTDAPLDPMIFNPMPEYLEAWNITAGYSPQGIQIEGLSLNKIESVFPNSKVTRGGNPLETLANLSTSKTIILSNSSFGYVAALLSESANVYLPKEFWHPPLSKWQSF